MASSRKSKALSLNCERFVRSSLCSLRLARSWREQFGIKASSKSYNVGVVSIRSRSSWTQQWISTVCRLCARHRSNPTSSSPRISKSRRKASVDVSWKLWTTKASSTTLVYWKKIISITSEYLNSNSDKRNAVLWTQRLRHPLAFITKLTFFHASLLKKNNCKLKYKKKKSNAVAHS